MSRIQNIHYEKAGGGRSSSSYCADHTPPQVATTPKGEYTAVLLDVNKVLLAIYDLWHASAKCGQFFFVS